MHERAKNASFVVPARSKNFYDLCYVALVVDTLTTLVVFETLFLINVLQ